MELYNLNAAYSLAETLYAVTPNENDFGDIALNGWELIGNRHTRLYRYVGDTKDKVLELPCNVDTLESVHLPINDAQMTSPLNIFPDFDNLITENYIDAWKFLDDPYNQRGKYLKYDQGNNQLFFQRDYRNVIVIYHGVINDEADGLPLVNDKELRAVAAYVAWAWLYREGLKKRDQDTIKIAQTVKQEWLQLCNAARIPTKFTQNDMDRILDVKTRWDRKKYGKSLAPIL